MPRRNKLGSEFINHNAHEVGAAVADITGRYHGHVRIVVRKADREQAGVFRIKWVESGEETLEQGDNILSRYTTQSAGYNQPLTKKAGSATLES